MCWYGSTVCAGVLTIVCQTMHVVNMNDERPSPGIGLCCKCFNSVFPASMECSKWRDRGGFQLNRSQVQKYNKWSVPGGDMLDAQTCMGVFDNGSVDGTWKPHAMHAMNVPTINIHASSEGS